MKCLRCKFWIFTNTVGSPNTPVWHCRFGFSPCLGCLKEAYYNIKCIRDYYRKHPEDLQLKLNF